MITASKNMSELKLYTCKTWDCLQTLQLNSAPSQWKMDINVTGEYLVATNIHTKVSVKILERLISRFGKITYL